MRANTRRFTARVFLLIMAAAFIFLLTGCLGTKKITESNTATKEKEKTEVKKDSSTNTETNQEIKDRIVVQVPQSDNKEINAMFEILLSQLNTSKSSGSNSYKSRYDEETRQLVIDFIVAKTENKETSTSTDTKQNTSFEQRTDEYIYKKIIALPWWLYVGAAVWFLPGIISKVVNIYNPVMGFIKGRKT